MAMGDQEQLKGFSSLSDGKGGRRLGSVALPLLKQPHLKTRAGKEPSRCLTCAVNHVGHERRCGEDDGKWKMRRFTTTTTAAAAVATAVATAATATAATTAAAAATIATTTATV